MSLTFCISVFLADAVLCALGRGRTWELRTMALYVFRQLWFEPSYVTWDVLLYFSHT